MIASRRFAAIIGFTALLCPSLHTVGGGPSGSDFYTGKPPIGKGLYKSRWAESAPIANQSTWGEGEFVLAKTTFQLDSLDYDYFRLHGIRNADLFVGKNN